MQALNIAPGLFRERFSFEKWADFDPQLLDQLIEEAEANQLDQLLAPILGSDIDAEVLEQAVNNAQSCDVDRSVRGCLKSMVLC